MGKQSFLIGALVAAPAVLAAALSLGNLSFQSGSRVWVEGTSTTRGYRCESTAIQGGAQARTVAIGELASVPRADLTIPVSTLDCRNGTMNGHMRRALQADQHANIRFVASSVTVASNGAARMAGNLTIGGQTRPATVTGTAVAEDGQLRVRGTHSLDMTDFGVRPPSLMMGTMRVRPAVTIGFDVALKP